MKRASRQIRLVCAAVAMAVAAAGCHRPAEQDAVAEDVPAPPSEATPEPVPADRHALVASPPVAAADLDRLLGLGFTPDEVLAEVERRGVLKRIDGSDRTHVLSLPRGERLLDAMDSPANLLSADALVRYGRRQAGGSNLEQWQLSRASTQNTYAYAAQAQTQSYSVRSQQMADRSSASGPRCSGAARWPRASPSRSTGSNAKPRR